MDFITVFKKGASQDECFLRLFGLDIAGDYIYTEQDQKRWANKKFAPEALHLDADLICFEGMEGG